MSDIVSFIGHLFDAWFNIGLAVFGLGLGLGIVVFIVAALVMIVVGIVRLIGPALGRFGNWLGRE